MNYFNGLKKVLILASILAFIGGCGGGAKEGKFTEEEMAVMPLPFKSGLPEPSGGYALSVDTEVITVEEVVEPVKEDFAPLARQMSYEKFAAAAGPRMQSVVLNSIADMLLYQKAKEAMPENVDEMLEKAVDKEVKKFVASHGGNYSEAEKALRRMNMTWKGLRDYKRRYIITQSFLADTLQDDRPIKYRDLLDYYNSIKDEEFVSEPYFQFRLIDIQPAKLDVPEGQEPVDAAREKADEIYRKLKNGEKFAQLATEYSDCFSASEGGLWEKVSPGSLASPYDVIEKKVKQMEVGEVSKPIEIEDHIFIVKLVDRSSGEEVPFEAVQDQIEEEYRMQQRRKALDELMVSLVKQVDVGDTNKFVQMCLRRIYNESNV